MGNNLQMKNNPFRSNAISGRADGHRQRHRAPPPLLPTNNLHIPAAQTKAGDSTGDRGEMTPEGGAEEDGKQARV